MKKRILTALAVATAIGAQAQNGFLDNPSEYINPFAGIGAFNYIQKQSDGELNKWFLSGKNAEDKYFTLEKYCIKGKNGEVYTIENRAARVISTGGKNPDDVQFCIVLDISNKFPQDKDNYLTISYDIYYDDGKDNDFSFVHYNLSVSGEKENNNLVKGHRSNHSSSFSYEEKNLLLDYTSGHDSEISKLIEYGKPTYRQYHSFEVKDNKYLVIQFDFGSYAGAYYINNIKIVGNDANDESIEQGKYFTDTYFFKEKVSLVHFDTSGGNEIDDVLCIDLRRHIDKTGEYQEWSYGAITPTKEGYNFVDWEFNNQQYLFIDWYGNNCKGNFNTSLYAQDITLTAKWEAANNTRTSINENTMENIYIINNVLTTDIPSNISIFAVNGTLVSTEHNTTMIDISGLKKGLYIAKVNEKTFKFVR